MNAEDRAEAHQLLVETRKTLARPYGWCRFRMDMPNPKAADGFSRCLEGAMWHITERDFQCRCTVHANAESVLAGLIRAKTNGKESRLGGYNDASLKKDVLALVDEGIKATA